MKIAETILGMFDRTCAIGKLVLFLVLGLLLGISQQYAIAADWRPVPGSASTTFDASRITRVSPTVIRVWERYTLSEESLDNVRKKGLSEEYVDYSYTIALRQIDCKRQTHGFVSIHNFNSRGYPTAPSVDFKDSEIEMTAAPPDTKAEGLIAAACDYANKTQKKK
jgi:hypothetical protein